MPNMPKMKMPSMPKMPNMPKISDCKQKCSPKCNTNCLPKCKKLNCNPQFKCCLMPNMRSMPSIPKRYVLGIMGFLAIMTAHLTRSAFSVGILQMVQPINHSDSIDNNEVCLYSPITPVYEEPSVSYYYDWSEQIQGLLLGSFYLGYVFGHIPGAYFAQKFGGKWTLGMGILWSALFTVLTPVMVKGGDWPWLLVNRVLMGFGQGSAYPALNVLLTNWVPISEKATIATLVYSGLHIGNLIGNGVGGIVIGQLDSWESVFYMYSAWGLVWFILWAFVGHANPELHPYISKEEKEFLAEELASISPGKHSIPWKAILTSGPFWALTLANFGFDWTLYTMLSDLPKYFKSVLKFNIEQSGLWSSLPYLVMWSMAMTFSFICDKLISKKVLEVTTARKLFTVIAAYGAGVFLLAGSFAGCNQVLTVLFITLAMGMLGASYCGARVNLLDLAPKYAGTVTALVNAFGGLGGMVAPFVVGVITKNNYLSEWRLVFYIAFTILVITGLIFIICGSGCEQWWHTMTREEYDEERGKNDHKHSKKGGKGRNNSNDDTDSVDLNDRNNSIAADELDDLDNLQDTDPNEISGSGKYRKKEEV